jgi:hypothetical protein
VTDFDDEERPTRPDIGAVAARESVLRQLELLSITDLRSVARLLDCWVMADADDRILIEQVARRLMRKRPR